MRKILLSIILISSMCAYGQVAKWVIHPSYDHIRMLGDGYYIVSQNNKYGILDATEKEIVPLQYDHRPLRLCLTLLRRLCLGTSPQVDEAHP